MLRQLPGRVPHIVALVDRTGADITVSSVPGQPVEEKEIEGDSFQIRKFPGGGWAQHRYQHNAENKWIAQRRRGRPRASPRWCAGCAPVRAASPATSGPGRSSPTGPATCGRTWS